MTTHARERSYLDAVTDQLRTLGSVTLTREALAYLLAAVATPPGVPHDDAILLWQALADADPTLAREEWAQAWNTTPTRDRLHLAVLSARIPTLDPHHQ